MRGAILEALVPMERSANRDEVPPLNLGLLRALLFFILCAGVLVFLQKSPKVVDEVAASGGVLVPEEETSVWGMLDDAYASDGVVDGTTYENRSLGFRMTFPEGWMVSATTSSDYLLEARSDAVTAYVAAATYLTWEPLGGNGKFAPVALNSFASNLLKMYESTEWPVYTFVYTPVGVEVGDSAPFQVLIGVTNAEGYIYANDFYLFSNGPTYYALRFHYYNDVPTSERMSGVPEQVLQTVEFFDAE